MNTAVSNTSPIRYLVSLGEEELFARLFSKIFIPNAVFQELTHERTPEAVQKFVHSSPDWIVVANVGSLEDTSLKHLDAGEREAILLAEQMQADLLLMDEKKGRFTAIDRGIKVIGTLGILELAARQYPLDLSEIFEKLVHTNFKVSPSLIATILKRHQDQK